VSDADDFDGGEPVDEYNRILGALPRTVLEYLVTSIVDEPDGIVIETEEGRRGMVNLSLHVTPDDMGKVIGRRGRVAQALRTVVRAAAAKEGVEASVDIVD
jgi:uncharacterized protein